MRNRTFINIWAVATIFALFSSCYGPADRAGTLHVAAAANLSRLFPQLARACHNATGLTLVPSFGNTAQLAQQIESGGPFDLFLAADRKHVADLAERQKVFHDSVQSYALGRLVVYAPRRTDIRKLEDLTLASVKKIGIANADLSPYGAASVTSLNRMHLWEKVESKVVYGQNISAVLQFVESANVDAAFTALALVNESPGNKFEVDAGLHAPIDQALGIPTGTQHLEQARRAAQWFVSAEAQAIFAKSGYGVLPQDSGSKGPAQTNRVKP